MGSQRGREQEEQDEQDRSLQERLTGREQEINIKENRKHHKKAFCSFNLPVSVDSTPTLPLPFEAGHPAVEMKGLYKLLTLGFNN